MQGRIKDYGISLVKSVSFTISSQRPIIMKIESLIETFSQGFIIS